MTPPRICVVGASNIDLVSYVPRMPKIGETLHGTQFAIGYGGKGANQAVMAAKLGGEVAMVTKLGRDIFGEDTYKNYEAFGIDTTGVTFTDQAFSGVAPIAVNPEGDNSIIIVTGANDVLNQDDLEAVREIIAASQVLVCQLEISVETNLAALRLGKELGVQTIFNPAPARAELPEEIYGLCDIFCPNETETELLTGMPVTSMEEAEAAARVLMQRGCKMVILTLGERGSLLVSDDEVVHVAAEAVKPKDTTGAGDAFVGSLAYFLAAGKPLQDAMHRANKIAAISVQAPGTQTSFPDAKDLDPDLLA
ncbi:MAG: ribokinase [Chloroflexi bacterium]|nr:MAG: ribokinase [Chloroflexota bacterium]MBL1194718.1 ribokinase [Chloroflexota bacterium]NOH12011.1 ribokinase [Chloroflexota bacterium]